MNSANKKELNILSELTDLIEHNTRMLKQAEAGNWDQVKESEVVREKMINAFYKDAEQHHQPDVIANTTKELLLVNEKLKQLATHARDKVKSELSDLSKGKVAISAYEKHSR